MVRLISILLAALATLLSGSAQAQTEYKFGVVPQFEPRKLSAVWSPILAELEKRTGFRLVMVGSARIPEFEGEFEAGRYDFAYMNPYHAVRAARSQNYEPLIRDGAEKLYGILVTAKDGPIDKIADLAGKTIAFPAPNSIGASLLIRADLERQYKIRFTPIWAQTHTSAYLNAVLGKADAAGGVMATLRQQPQHVQDKLRIIHETRRVAPHPVVAHPRVPPAHREKLRQAFLDLGSTPDGRALMEKIPIRQAVPAKLADYLEIVGWGLDHYYTKGSE